ncbi:zonular occludens toxin domain-containing protein [Pseudomonas amygdali]|uniref:zonular occludens toxin domain-containing protein n=1 Tax=Pseudomonas amygdali TaxID=47877 RepID=UPI0039679743
MFKLVTGSPGDGKTSNELWEFLNAPQYQGRPKYCTPINGFEPEKHGVTPIEHIKIWQDLPDGSVIFCDEVQDFCGTNLGKDAPEWVQQLARHRHRGFDFIVTTQSPMFLHTFARKLAKPHVHYIRPWNMKGIQYSWDTVQNDPNAKSSKAMGTRKSVAPNPEVFKLYTSTVLDTHKARPPWKIIIGLSTLLLVTAVGVGWGVYGVSNVGKRSESAPSASQGHVSTVPGSAQTPVGAISNPMQGFDAPQAPRWTRESVTPAIPGLPHTAPVYDELTAPTDFPRVAACIQSVERQTCDCYTQQATPIDVPVGACEVFVKYRSFDPWLSGRKQNQPQPMAAAQPVQSPAAAPAAGARGVRFTVVGSDKPAEPVARR